MNTVSSTSNTEVRTPPSSLHPEDGGSRVLQNSGVLPHHYLA